MFCRETELWACVCKRERRGEEFSHLMETEKSNNLSSSSWRPGNVSGVTQSKSKGLQTKGANDVNPSLRSVEYQCIAPVDKKVEKGTNSSFLSFLLYSCSSMDDAHSHGEGNIFY